METKKYNKLALLGFIIGPVLIVLTTIAGFILRPDPGIAFVLIYPLMVVIPVSLILALVSLFTRKENQKGKGLAIITLVFFIIGLVISPILRLLYNLIFIR